MPKINPRPAPSLKKMHRTGEDTQMMQRSAIEENAANLKILAEPQKRLNQSYPCLTLEII